MTLRFPPVITFLVSVCFIPQSSHGLSVPSTQGVTNGLKWSSRCKQYPLSAKKWRSSSDDNDTPCPLGNPEELAPDSILDIHRRSIIFGAGIVTSKLSVDLLGSTLAQAAGSGGRSLSDLRPLIIQARSQMDVVPDLIKNGKWDSVRAVLVKPPLSDCWTKGANPNLLKDYASAVGDELPDGDELAALEAKEDARSHLRFLDMAVYNNIFNPIATEGTAGATKELIRSYFEDPTNEFKESMKALDDLITLGSPEN